MVEGVEEEDEDEGDREGEDEEEEKEMGEFEEGWACEGVEVGLEAVFETS